jgi:hypothetical protein
METLTNETCPSEGVARKAGSSAVAQEILILPVLYGGDEKPTIFIRRPINKFMAEKPA